MSWLEPYFHAAVIRVAGAALPHRAALNFVGFTVTDNPTANAVDIALPAGATAPTPGGASDEVQFNHAGKLGGATGVKVGAGFLSIATLARSPAASGYLRVDDEPGVVIAGTSGGFDYAGLAYSAGSASWTLGNTAQYANLDAYGVALYGRSSGVTAFDGRNSLTTDLAVVSQYLLANRTTSSSAGATTNFTFRVNPGEIWEVEWSGNLGCSGVGGVSLGLDCPAGSTLDGQVFGAASGGTTFQSSVMVAMNTAYGAVSTVAGPAPRMAQMKALVAVGGSAGDITLRMYSVINGQISTMYANAHFKARRAVGV